ncbi:MAG: hypothetical protein JJ863_34795 [Deltaproteobacteria bacterium]|nr:hypothetical protein [Deltaproteobacteria bacterium]
MGWAEEELGRAGRRSTSGTQLKAVREERQRIGLVGTGLDLGKGACRHGIYELQRQLILVDADRPARESHASPAGQLSLVVEGHAFLDAAKRGMSALLLDHLARAIVRCLPTHDIAGDGRAQANLVRDLREAMIDAQEATQASGIAEEGRASAVVLFTNEHFFWAARCGGGAIFLSRAGYLELLTAGTSADDDETPLDVLGAPLQPGDTFLLGTLGVARALETEVLGRALRDIGDNDEAVAVATRVLGDAALSAGIHEGSLIIARG